MTKPSPLFLVFLFGLMTTAAQATNYYADPSSAGSMANTGAFNSPWASLSAIFAANKTFTAGDTIFLRTGSHGYTIIKGVNTDFVVIMPQPGESPIIERIRVSASAAIPAAFWKLYQLTVQSESTGTTGTPSYTLLEVYPYATNITISECTVTSNLNTTGWSRDDWRNRCNSGIFTRGKLHANHIIEKNLIINTAFGLTVSSSNTIVRGNTVQNFTNDGSRVLGSDILFENNKIADLIKVMTVAENHDDLFQAFTYAAGGAGQDTLKNDIIRGNIFVNTSDTTRNFRGNAQGIGCFDGVFLNWRIENNIVITDHWHGISMYGAVNCSIVNNTVMDPYRYSPVDPYDNNTSNIGPTWIRIDKKTSGPPSSGNVVNNNLVANVVTIVSPTMGTASNNLILGALSNFSTYFTDVSNFGLPGHFDLHLKAGCPAIDAGDGIGAPLFDYDGISRPQGPQVDIGAYEYTSVNGIAEQPLPDQITLYPNPTSGNIRVNFGEEAIDKTHSITMYNTLGKSVYTSGPVPPQASFDIHLSGIPKGVYVVRIDEGDRVFSRVILVE